MPVCCDCDEDVPKATFAKAQLKKPAGKRRCKRCAAPLAGDPPDHPPPDPESAAGPSGGAACWICLEDDPDGHGPPRRDCACRGTSGYAHVACLVDYAAHRAQDIQIFGQRSDADRIGVSVGGGVVNPWRECPTCRQAYGGAMLHELALAMERRYCADGEGGNAKLSPKQRFWKDAAYDNLCGVLCNRGDFRGCVNVLRKRLELLQFEYYRELRSGAKRGDILTTDKIINVLCNYAEILTKAKTSTPPEIKGIIDQAENYGDEIRHRDGGRGLGAALRQHATLQREIGDHDRAYGTMKRAVALLEKADPTFASSLNGIHTRWDLADMMQAADSEHFIAGYDLKREILAVAQRTLGRENPHVARMATELKGFEERMGEEVLGFGRAFHSQGVAVEDVLASEVLAKGWCYTGQRVRVMSVVDGGYRGLLCEGDDVGQPNDDGSWEVSYIPFPAICFDAGTGVVLHDFKGGAQRRALNGKCGVVVDYELEDNNFDSLRMVVEVDAEQEYCNKYMRVKPSNVMPQVVD